jgi:hypothetical protein
MRRFKLFAIAALILGSSALAAQAQTGDLSAVHGIPGLAEPVDVYVNGSYLFSFEFGDSFGPAPVDIGTYDLEVYYQGAPVPGLSGTVEVEEGGNYTAVAHLNEDGSIAPLSLFVNEVSPVRRWFTRLQIHHLAAAPTVDASIRRGSSRFPQLELSGLSNGDRSTATDILLGRYNIGLLAGDSEVFNTGKLRLRSGSITAVYAVGVFPDSFELVYLPLN